MVFISEFSSPTVYERNSGLKFFFLFLGLSHPILAKNYAGKRFFNFLIFFFYFFWNFLSRIEYEQNSGLNFVFFSFSANLIPFWLKIMLERGFLIFWFFFSIFFGIFLPGSSLNEIWDKIFFSVFIGLSHPILAKNNAGKGFFLFFKFFLFFLEFSWLRQVWTEVVTKFFFSLSRPILSRFG